MIRWIVKSGLFFQFVLYILFIVALWIPVFIHPVSVICSPEDGPIYTFLVSFFDSSPEFSTGVAFGLIILQTFLIFLITHSNGFFGRRNFLPAIIALLVYSWNPDFQALHAMLPAGFFLLLAIQSLLVAYGKHEMHKEVFNASFFISVASLFYLPSAFLLVFLWFVLITYRVSGWREYLISFVGFGIPFVYYFSGLYWNDNLEWGLQLLIKSFFNFTVVKSFTNLQMAWLIASVLILLLGIFAVLNVMKDKVISLRRRSWALFDLVIAASIAVCLTGFNFMGSNYLFALPMSFFITGSIFLPKRPFWSETLTLAYFLFFVVIRAIQFL